MKPSELTASVVREELSLLISKYPERTGNIAVGEDEDDTTCVYYTNSDGDPISFPAYWEDDLENLMREVTLDVPVCIVGQWIENFHPEFKDDSVIAEVLFRNSTMRHAEVPFDFEVKTLLVRAQDQQDSGTSWGNIDLDKADAYSGY